MIALILSIFTSVCIFVLFKLFGKFRIDTFQAIVFNYFTALLCGILFFRNEWDSGALNELTWLPSVLVCAVLFISIFALMGISSLKNGIGSTSVAAKMSMGMSMGIMIFIYKEPFTSLKVIGIVLAIIGVLLVSKEKSETTSKGKSFWMLIVIFTGSVVLDVLLNYSQRYLLGSLSPSLFTAIAFGIAGIIGLLILMMGGKKNKISLKNIIAGIFLGIPNFFSIFLLLEAYETAPLNDSDVVAIINICIVCLSTLVGFICFSEKLTSQKIIGIISIILSIYLISEY